MDKLVEAALVFLPQLLFIFLVGGFMKQDISAIFYLPKYEDPKTIKMSNHLYLYGGFILVSLIVFPISLIQYINGSITDFYQIARLLIAGNGMVFILTFLANYLFRNVSYNEGQITHKKYLSGTAFYVEKITKVELNKGFLFEDIVLYADKRSITVNTFCSNINTLLYLIIKGNKAVISEELLVRIYGSNKFYMRETETLEKLIEVIHND